MNKHQYFDAFVPMATILGGAFGAWCGYRRRWVTMFIGLTLWFIFAVWMQR